MNSLFVIISVYLLHFAQEILMCAFVKDDASAYPSQALGARFVNLTNTLSFQGSLSPLDPPSV